MFTIYSSTTVWKLPQFVKFIRYANPLFFFDLGDFMCLCFICVHIASHTSGIIVEMDALLTRKWIDKELNDSPVARYLKKYNKNLFQFMFQKTKQKGSQKKKRNRHRRDLGHH